MLMFILIGGKARAGKDTLAKILKNKFGGHIISLAQPIKKKIPLNGRDKEEVRPKWIEYGAKARSVDENFFVNIAKAKVLDIILNKTKETFTFDYVYVPDVRYENEMREFKKTECVFSIYVDASLNNILKRFETKEEAEKHKKTITDPSENSIKKESFDYIIDNNGTLEEFEKNIKKSIFDKL